MRWLTLAVLVGCSSSGNRTISTQSSPPTKDDAPPTTTTSTANCADAVAVIENGVDKGMQCGAPAGHVIVDLRDAWTPKLFAPGPDGTAPDFRSTYLAIASERDTAGKPLAPDNALVELYGIVPSFSIVRARLAEQARYRCHAAIDSAPLSKLTKPFGQEHDGLIKAGEFTRRTLGAQLERARTERKLASIDALKGDRELGAIYDRWKPADEQHAGIVAAQQHLVCDGYMTQKDVDGLFNWATGHALELYQRRNFLLPNNRIDAETRQAMATDPKELDFRFALRILRERVVDATGLIEDGTAGTGPQPILGRYLEPEAMRAARGAEKPLANAAPDLVSAAVEAAAKQLGWTDPAGAAAFLAKHPGGVRVAITLPAAPAYHAKHMDLSAVIDRGDVYYDDVPTPRVVMHRPSITLYVQDGSTKRPLVRWPTTIGGWSDVNLGGGVVQRWKESDVGPRQWREILAAPTWMPPGSTPDRDLVKWVGAGKWDLKRSIIGPGPHAAFGMVLLPHYLPQKNRQGQFEWHGIGTHGSATVMSVINGTSHGCHRLFNQLAVRLGSFLLAHRDHATKGQAKEFYRRTVQFAGTFPIKIDTRGFLYELNPPVPIEVTSGRILSARQIPPANSVAAAP